MRTALGIGQYNHHTCGPKLAGRVILLCLVALMMISLFLQFAYFHSIIPLNKQVSRSSITTRTQEETGFLLQGDENQYYRIALNLLNGRGYSLSEMDQPPEPTAYRPPLFPILLVMVFRVFGPLPEYGVRVNQALIALLIPLSFWLGRSLAFAIPASRIHGVPLERTLKGFYLPSDATMHRRAESRSVLDILAFCWHGSAPQQRFR